MDNISYFNSLFSVNEVYFICILIVFSKDFNHNPFLGSPINILLVFSYYFWVTCYLQSYHNSQYKYNILLSSELVRHARLNTLIIGLFSILIDFKCTIFSLHGLTKINKYYVLLSYCHYTFIYNIIIYYYLYHNIH